MGVVVSSHVQSSAFFLISGIIGYVGFAFTIGTFLRVVWVNLETVAEAPHEVHEYLTNLRQELLEEKANIKALRKQLKKRARWRGQHPGLVDKGLGSYRGLELDDVSLKTMSDMIRSLIKQFRDIEHPFLPDGEDGISGEKKHNRRRTSSVSPYYEHSAYASPTHPEKSARGVSRARGRSPNRETDYVDDEDLFWAQRVQYAKLTLGRRLKWISLKPKAQSMFSTLSKVQTRRIAQQVGGIALLMHESGNVILDIEDRLKRVDERVSRVVGVRRIDG